MFVDAQRKLNARSPSTYPHTHIHTQNLTCVGSYTHLGGVLVRVAHLISFGQQQKGKNMALFASPEAHRADTRFGVSPTGWAPGAQ